MRGSTFFAMLLITFIPNIQLKHIFEATFLEYYSQTFISARDFSATYVRFMCVLCVAHDKQILKRDCGIRNVLIACAYSTYYIQIYVCIWYI